MSGGEILIRASGTLLGGVVLWMLKSGVQAAIRLRDDVHDIKTNHLIHLQEEISSLKDAIKELSHELGIRSGLL